MSLLQQIQTDCLDETKPLGPILLKLSFLGAQLGSDALEDWVRIEGEGYPEGVDVPEYRHLTIDYRGTFNCIAQILNEVPIATAAIKKFAGDGFVKFHLRQNMAAIDDLRDGDGPLTINVSDLIIKLQGKVYPDCSIVSITGVVSRSDLAAIQHIVRSRILTLTTEIGKAFPDAADIAVGTIPDTLPEPAAVTTIFNKVVHGNETNVISTGAGASIQIDVLANDKASLATALQQSGLTEVDAKELAEIAADEKPEEGKSYGRKAGEWMARKLDKAVDGTVKYGGKVGADLITSYLKQFYDL